VPLFCWLHAQPLYSRPFSSDDERVNTAMRCATALAFSICSTASLFAGGSGLNVVVVVNTNSANSLELGNYYCEKRAVPPQNVLRIGWTGGVTDWTRTNLDTILRAPLNAMLTSRQLTNQIEFVLLSMDIPYRVIESTGSTASSGVNSTTAALFYGFKVDGCTNGDCPAGYASCSLPPASSNSYAGSEGIFRETPPVSAASNSWLAMMLTSSDLAAAKSVVDRGIASDGVFPTQTVYLIKSSDVARNVRYVTFDDAIFNTRLRGDYSMRRTNTSTTSGLGVSRGFQNSVAAFTFYDGFVPGAMADSLTSFGGYLFENSGQTDARDFLEAGATASFGTVAEPCNYLEKFASPQNYFYQVRGFSIAECYYQSVTNPYQGIFVGEPLAATFARAANGAWSQPPPNALLAGTTNLTVQFAAADASRPVQLVDLFLDGTFAETLTNIPPRTNNLLYVTINGFPTNYTIAADATLTTVASNLTARLNGASYTNATKVRAFAHGDRIQLQSFNFSAPGTNVSISISNAAGLGVALTTCIQASRSNFLDSIAFGIRSFVIGVGVVTNDVLTLTATKTNGMVVTTSVTNYAEGVTLNQFLQTFMAAINSTPGLQGDDGLVAEDLTRFASTNYYQFNLRARSAGWDAAQIQTHITGSFDIFPPDNQRLDENLSDLQPRNHLYITAGVTNLVLPFALNTTNYADGYHELTAVAYEGSHVRTQKRVSQSVRIQNTPLATTFTCLLCDTNTGLEATLQFLVAANTNTITRIELFSTGGSWGVVSNQPSATFSLAATNLGLGRHPFYAFVTRNDGKQYRTETKWIRLVGDEPPFALAIAAGSPTVSWPATAGRRYEILSATNATDVFMLRDAVTPTNSPGQWSETNNSSPQRLYRVRSAP
jgi:uncharacterized protein (TIGR03790 family)